MATPRIDSALGRARSAEGGRERPCAWSSRPRRSSSLGLARECDGPGARRLGRRGRLLPIGIFYTTGSTAEALVLAGDAWFKSPRTVRSRHRLQLSLRPRDRHRERGARSTPSISAAGRRPARSVLPARLEGRSTVRAGRGRRLPQRTGRPGGRSISTSASSEDGAARPSGRLRAASPVRLSFVHLRRATISCAPRQGRASPTHVDIGGVQVLGGLSVKIF
ncbi:MAG: hypothetical protein MZV64_22840 [Ignavibacteriales bacterium]|nr:hypothetical protein [Ignavibacteriales bacterium]